jgi:hypothetical protein
LEVDRFIRQLTVPVDPSGADYFSQAIIYHSDRVVEQATECVGRYLIPSWYKRELDAPAFIIYPLTVEMRALGLLYADDAKPTFSFPKQNLPVLDRLRNQLISALRLQR